MATVARLSKMQRCKYLSPDRWISGELAFWKNKQGYATAMYDEALSEWLKDLKLVKEDLR